MGRDTTLEVQVERRGGALVLAPQGEVDLNTAPILEDALKRATRVPQVPIVVDLSGLEFLACRGIGVLAGARAALSAAGRPLVVTGARGPVGRALRLCDDAADRA